MRKSRVSLIAVVLFAAAGGIVAYRLSDAKEATTFRYATATRGDIMSTVSSTGTLNAVTTVQVGTQVSGQLAALYADFNDHVKKGQLLARIDSTLAYQSVQDAEANLERVQAQLVQAQADYDRNKKLFDDGMLAASEFSNFQLAVNVGTANLKSAQVSLDKARQNLGFTNIYAPIDGVIVQRLVDVGQTVAASLSAPQLFLIANSLTQMQILATVDESDIGLIKEEQPVSFTVQSYTTRTFTGTVKQVRLQSTTVNNVVNYTVVIEVANPDGKLLPGMTATVAFQTGEAKDAILVPNAALRYKGTDAMIAAAESKRTAALGDTTRGQSVGVGDSARNASQGSTPQRGASQGSTAQGNTPPVVAPNAAGGGNAGGPPGGPGGLTRARAGARTGTSGTLWYVGADGQPALARVRTGLSDGQHTVVISRDITAGTQLIIGASVAASTNATSSSTTKNPLQPQAQSGGGRGGPGGF